MRILSIHEIQPIVRIANYIRITPEMTWQNRRIPDLELILVVAGEYEYTTESRRYLLSEGDVLFIEPGVLHSKRMLNGAPHGLLSAIHLEFLPNASWLASDYRLTPHPEVVTRSDDFEYLRGRFRQLAEVYQGYSTYREELTSAIAREIVLLLACRWHPSERNQISPRVQTMIDYIRANLTSPISRLSLAQTFHISPAYVNSLFQRELGITPTALINRERVVSAYNLMFEQGLSVKEAAQAVGFQDQFYFSRVYKRIMGYPPSAVASNNNSVARLFPIG